MAVTATVAGPAGARAGDRTHPLLALRRVQLEVEVLRDGHQVGELLGVCAETVQQRRQRHYEVRRHLGAVVAHLLRVRRTSEIQRYITRCVIYEFNNKT